MVIFGRKSVDGVPTVMAETTIRRDRAVGILLGDAAKRTEDDPFQPPSRGLRPDENTAFADLRHHLVIGLPDVILGTFVSHALDPRPRSLVPQRDPRGGGLDEIR